MPKDSYSKIKKVADLFLRAVKGGVPTEKGGKERGKPGLSEKKKKEK